jgi:hypothetical protein
MSPAQLGVDVNDFAEHGGGAQHQVVEVAEVLHERSYELAIRLACAITRDVPPYRGASPVPFDTVAESCGA